MGGATAKKAATGRNKMGKKRKSAKGSSGKAAESTAQAKTHYDVNEEFADSEDEFLAGRDRILLDEEPAQKRRRKLQEEEAFLEPSDEEVLSYDEDEDEEDGVENAEAELDSSRHDGSAGSDAGEEEEEEEDGDNLRDWGTSRADYYNADAIETEADALEEEAEAKRLQQKRLQGMTEADFGFDADQWVEEGGENDQEVQGTITEKLPDIEIPDDMPVSEKMKILTSRYPEFDPLMKDFIDLQGQYEDLRLAAEAAEAVIKHKSSPRKRKISEVESKPQNTQTPMALMRFRALSAYLAAIGMYFALLTSTPSSGNPTARAMPPHELREHPVIDSLVQCRQLWDRIKALPVPDIDELASEVEHETEKESHVVLNGDNQKPTAASSINEKTKRKSRNEKAAEAAQAARATAVAERAARMRETEASLATLSSLLPTSKKPIRSGAGVVADRSNDSDFGDETGLTAQEAAEKAQRKKSLRFYTSQIAQKSNRRGAASREAGGDADLPYKERLKDRQIRLIKEAEKRGKEGTAGLKTSLDETGNGDDDEEAMRLAKEIRGDNDSDDYYDMIATKTQQKKADQKALAAAHVQASQHGGQVHIEETVIGPDGKRAVTYAIEKNKGLAPRRKKEVRNPRVKKRKKYDEKMKKLGSMRQVYRGGEGRGGYGGELTGIKTNLVKSIKL